MSLFRQIFGQGRPPKVVTQHTEFDGLEAENAANRLDEQTISVRDPQRQREVELAYKVQDWTEVEAAPTTDIDVAGPSDFNDSAVSK